MDNFHTDSSDSIVNLLQVDPTKGLPQNEANKRLNEYGANKLPHKKRKPLLVVFANHLNDVLIYVLLSAVLITAIMGEYVDAIIILAVVLVNALLGTIQELRATNAIESLHQLTTPKALVIRDGQKKTVPSEDLVRGDLVLLESGSYVPADLRLLRSTNLQIDESTLTGESVAAVKDSNASLPNTYVPLGDRTNLAYMSSMVTNGRGRGVVVATGGDTEVGQIASHLDSSRATKTPLEVRLSKLGATIGKAAIAICVIIFFVALLQGRDLAEMFLTAVSLAVAAVPEGLAAIVAIVLSLGVSKMAKRKAIVKKLPAVETLGSVNIICSDKTGTLTQNKMTVQQFFTTSGGAVDMTETPALTEDGTLLVHAFVLSSNASLDEETSAGDPTELALLHWADTLNVSRKELHSSQPRMEENPFDSKRKMMSTLNRNDEQRVVYAKGAIDALILKCSKVVKDGKSIPMTESLRSTIQDAANNMADNALRILAAAYKPVNQEIAADDFEEDLVFIGLVGMMDPPREEAKDAISMAKKAGIRTIMITGDHKNTAVAIAAQLDITADPSETITGAEIDHLSSQELEEKIDRYRVFARVSPEHKVSIVKAFQAQNKVVAMTGDGVNDAPSLYTADIGIAMGKTGTDVARNAADMVLADDNFATIVSATEQGRNIYSNIKKFVVFLLSCNLGEVLCMFAAIAAGLPLPLLATQLLWINLVTDMFPAMALGVDPGNKSVMKEKPRSIHENFFSGGGVRRILIAGVLIGTLTLVAFLLGYRILGHDPLAEGVPEEAHSYARTLAFLTIIACQLFYSLSFRVERSSIFSKELFANRYLWGAICLGFALQCILLYIPPMQDAFRLQAVGLKEWGMVVGLGLVPLLANELIKRLFPERNTT